MFRRLMAALVICIPAGGVLAQQLTPLQQVPMPAEQTAPSAGEAPSPSAFVEQASGSNLVAIVSSELALRKSQDPAIRSFAETMVSYHKTAQRQLKTSAGADNVDFLPFLNSDQEAEINALNNAAGNQFDQTYLDLQLVAQQRAVGLLGAYAANGPDGNLKVYAQALYPKVRTDLAKVQELKALY